MEQLVILIFIGAISLVNWLIKRSGEIREQKRLRQKLYGDSLPTDDTAAHSFDPQRNTDSPSAENVPDGMRKLMEALGIELADEEPRPVTLPQQTPKPQNIEPASHKPDTSKSKRSDFRSKLAKFEKSIASATPIQPRAPLITASRTSSDAVSAPSSRISALLRNPSSLRDAIILREILGPCKSA